jgi:hypothetical protein
MYIIHNYVMMLISYIRYIRRTQHQKTPNEHGKEQKQPHTHMAEHFPEEESIIIQKMIARKYFLIDPIK